MEDTDPDSKAPRRTVWDLMWENGGLIEWAPNYMEQYNLKIAEWRFNAVTKTMD